MDGCCAVQPVATVDLELIDTEEAVREDPVGRGEFEAAIRRLERKMQQLELQLQAAQYQPIKAPEPGPVLPPIAETSSPSQASAWQDPDVTTDRVQWGESVWSLPLVLDFKVFPVWDGVFSVLLLLVNLCMQAMFSGILLSDDFAGAGVQVEEERENARRWRISLAHDWRYMDLSETSLATRVCQSDGALILSTPQAELIDQINSFLGLGPESFEPGVLQPGILLCSLCILHWSLCVYKEFRSVWLAFEAVITVPRGRTVIRENRLISLSTSRVLLIMASFVLRVAIASIMLVAGVQWLGRTTSITELMLNAVALNGIMDVDELLFAGFTPVSVQQAVRKLEPITMKYSRGRSQRESFVLFLLLAATMLVPYLVFLEPLGAGMINIKWEMCGGNQTFVVASNPEVQQIIGLHTREAGGDREPSLIEIAVDRHKFQDAGPPEYIFFSASLKQFTSDMDETMTQAGVRAPFCVETDALKPGSPFHNDPVIQPILEARLRSGLVSLGEAPTTTCDGVAHLCSRPEARMLRLVCGDTCGCTNPYSSPWHKVEAQGCSGACNQQAHVAMVGCEDQPAGEVWQDFWERYPAAMADFYGQNVSQAAIWPMASAVARQLRLTGCSGLQQRDLQIEPLTQTPWCSGHENFFRPLASSVPDPADV